VTTNELIVKLAGQLPKGDANGVADYTLAESLFQNQIEHRSQPPRVALVIYGVREAKAGKDNVDSVVLEVRRFEPVSTVEGRRLAEQMLDDEYAARTGQAIPPHDLAQLSKSAFADLPRTTAQIDEKETRERDLMSPTDELRKHLERVHGTPEAHLLTAEAADSVHGADHRKEMFTTGPLAHEEDWIGWTRADLELAEIDADDLPGEGPTVVDDQPSLLDDGAREAAEDETEPDPHYGKDLDDEDGD
jgi:hypothetical protein